MIAKYSRSALRQLSDLVGKILREKFKGYYRPTKAEEDDMWASAHIVMDTNVVLDLYKYHAKTTSLYVRSLRKFKQQLWLPYQVALEFHKNRPKVRAETTKGHKERIKDLESIRNKIQQNSLKSKLSSSTVEEELIAKTEEAIDALKSELKQLSDEVHVNSPDKLLDHITDLFDGRVGDAPSADRLAELDVEAKQRFDNFVPPGYEDRKTKALGEEYGDFYLWRQTMDYAKEHGKSIIIATEDNKVDWWQKINGDEIVGPRPELVQEFRSETGQEIIFYSGRDFFRQLSDRAKIAGSSEDLAGALADVSSVSDKRSAAESAAWVLAAEALERRQSLLEDNLDRTLQGEGWRLPHNAEEDKEGRVLRDEMYRLTLEERQLRKRMSSYVTEMEEAEDNRSRSRLQDRAIYMQHRLRDLEKKMERVSNRIVELDKEEARRAWQRERQMRGKMWLEERLAIDESHDDEELRD